MIRVSHSSASSKQRLAIFCFIQSGPMRGVAWLVACLMGCVWLSMCRAQESQGATEMTRVDVGGRSLSMNSMGEGSPTVLIEAGMGEPGLSGGRWQGIAERIAKTNRVVLYDRAGLGESDGATESPRSSLDIAEDLHAMLAKAKVKGPYLLVGHSLGGMHARVFCGQYPDEVVGLVLVDASHPDQDEAWLHELPNEAVDEPDWSRNARKFLRERSRPENNPEGLDGKKSEDQARRFKTLRNIPVVVLMHSPTFRLSAELPDEVATRMEAVSQKLQRDFLNLSAKSSLHVSKLGGHQLHVEDPDLVVQGIREAISIATGRGVSAEPAVPKIATQQTLDDYLSYLESLGKFNGSVLVACRDEVLLRKGYGYRDAAAKLSNEVDTRFRIYSTTKPFTSAILLKLVELGELSLSDPVSKFIPELVSDRSLTIDHLLKHTSGLPDYANSKDVMGSDLPALIKLLASTPRSFQPGKGWQYSNTNYCLLGHIIQSITGQPYEQVVTERILVPLRMEASGFDFEAVEAEKRAIAYRFISESDSVQAQDLRSTETFAAGGLYSTVDDLFRFAKGIRSFRFLSRETMDDAWKPVPGSPGYGRGWEVRNQSGIGEIVSHSGGAPGFRSDFSLSRDGEWTVVLLSNSDATNIHDVRAGLYRLLSGQEVKQPNEVRIGREELANYVGVYRSTTPIAMTICVSILDGRLAVSVPGQSVDAILFTGSEFYHLERDARITFVQQPGSEASAMKVQQGPFAVSLQRVAGGWGLLGTATPQGWEGKQDISLKETSDQGVYQAWGVQLSDGEIKFRFANDWAVNLGGQDPKGYLEQDGPNIPVKAGRYDVMLDLRNFGVPTFSISPSE